MFLRVRHLHALETVVKSNIGIEVAAICVEMQECPRSSREGTAPALAQPWRPTQGPEQRLEAIQILIRRVPHAPSMTGAPLDPSSHLPQV